MKRTITISEEFGIWRIERTGSTVTGGTLFSAILKAAKETPGWSSAFDGGTKLAITATTIERLMPKPRPDNGGMQGA